MGHQQKIQGVILRRNNVGEADRIVTLLTPQGKLAVVARGIRKLASRKAGALELFQVVDLVVSETGSLPTVSEATTREFFPRLREDLAAASQAFWAAELVDRLVQDEGGGTLYPVLVDYLRRVEAGANSLDIRAFELSVLLDLGSQPELKVCVHCGHTLQPGKFGWSNQLGGVLDADCLLTQVSTRPISEAAIKALRILTEHRLAISQRLTLDDKVASEIEDILHHYLEALSERRWRTPELMGMSAASP